MATSERDVFRHPIRVYYEDTDFSGAVYHAQYLKFFERGRTEFLRALGVHHSELAREGLNFAVTHMEIDFKAAARIDDELTVETRRGPMSGARLTLGQTIRRGETVIARAEVTIAIVDGRGKPARIPAHVKAALSR